MYFQDPSLLQFQKRMQEAHNENNLSTLFHVFQIPADTQLRKIIDNVPSEEIEKIFSTFFKLLQRAKQPFIEDLSGKNMSFTLVAKPDDHKIMFQTIENRDRMGKMQEMEVIDEKGNLHTYRWTNDVKLNGNKDAQKVNFFEYEFFNQALDRITYKNSWVTNLVVGKENIQKLVRGGRARWKVENEAFNTLKNQGYHVEHSFGHGDKNLCRNFYLLNLIAFFMHQIFELTDGAYQKLRAKLGTRIEFFNNLRSFMRIPGYKDWYHFLAIIYDPEISVNALP